MSRSRRSHKTRLDLHTGQDLTRSYLDVLFRIPKLVYPSRDYLGEPVVRPVSPPREFKNRIDSAKRAYRLASKAMNPVGYAVHTFQEFLESSLPEPIRTTVCEARRVRKEVLHALGIAGSGVGKPVFDDDSKVKCK